ncbi:Unknown protein [Striga hermonthica]|uniref:Uncharacterized protein n=1 Tax=Striga hermonthica TaxID=68872 RepID=A0A9N7R7H4_STRHE|nr:Unknown protein [Striga hermonthica]
MAWPQMDPQYEQRLIEEVIYLHSLWHQGDEDLMDGDDGREEYSFFYKVFKEDTELREYYEKNFVRGEFGCLVCGALGGKKTGKKYKGCLALVQHSINIAKTKKKTAHRAFGLAVCKVLSWDINELSSIVSLLAQGDNGGENKENSVAVLNNVVSLQGNIVQGKNEGAALESRPSDSGISPDDDEGDMNPSSCSRADKNLEDLGMVSNLEEPAAQDLTNGSGSDDDNDTPLVTQTVLNVEIDAVKGENDEAAPETGAVGAEDLPNVDGNMGIGSGYNKEIPSASIDNVLTVEGDVVKSKTNVVPERVDIGPGSSPAGDGGDMKSLACLDADQNSEKIEVLLSEQLEKHASEVSAIVPENVLN